MAKLVGVARGLLGSASNLARDEMEGIGGRVWRCRVCRCMEEAERKETGDEEAKSRGVGEGDGEQEWWRR